MLVEGHAYSMGPAPVSIQAVSCLSPSVGTGRKCFFAAVVQDIISFSQINALSCREYTRPQTNLDNFLKEFGKWERKKKICRLVSTALLPWTRLKRFPLFFILQPTDEDLLKACYVCPR